MNTNQIVDMAEKNAFKAAQDFCVLKNIKSGLTKNQHAAIILHALMEISFNSEEILNDQSKKIEAFATIAALENCSALRQKLEKDGTLAESKVAGLDGLLD